MDDYRDSSRVSPSLLERLFPSASALKIQEIVDLQNRTYAQDLVATGQKQLDAGETNAAMDSFMNALEMDPSCADAYVAKGMLLYREGMLQQASKEFDFVLSRLDPQNPQAQYWKQRLAQEMNQTSASARPTPKNQRKEYDIVLDVPATTGSGSSRRKRKCV